MTVTIRSDDLIQPVEERDGQNWIVHSAKPDYMGCGATLEEARLHYWSGLAQTLWLLRPQDDSRGSHQ